MREPRGVVLDLRGNPGGLFRQAVLTADAFLSEWRDRFAARPHPRQPAHLAGRPCRAARRRADGGADRRPLRFGLGAPRRGAPGERPRDGHGAAELRQGQRADHRLAGRRQGRAAPYDGALSRAVRAQRPAHGRRPRHRARRGAWKYYGDAPARSRPGTALSRARTSRRRRRRAWSSRAARLRKRTADTALACALVFLDAGGIDAFVAALESVETAAAH